MWVQFGGYRYIVQPGHDNIHACHEVLHGGSPCTFIDLLNSKSTKRNWKPLKFVEHAHITDLLLTFWENCHVCKHFSIKFPSGMHNKCLGLNNLFAGTKCTSNRKFILHTYLTLNLSLARVTELESSYCNFMMMYSSILLQPM